MKNTAGYTLIELLIVVAVLGIVTSIGAFSVSSYRVNVDLRLAQQAIQDIVYQAQSRTLAGEYHNGSVVQGGYGVILEQGSGELVLFADCDGNQYNSRTGCNGQDEEVERRDLSNTDQLYVHRILATGRCVSTGCQLVIYFKAPYANPPLIFTKSKNAQNCARDSVATGCNALVPANAVERIQVTIRQKNTPNGSLLSIRDILQSVPRPLPQQQS